MFPILPEGISHVDINFFTHFTFSAGSPIALEQQLPTEQLLDVPFFKFYVRFLQDLQAAQPLKLTQKGNLNRKFVHQLYDHRILPSKYIDDGTLKLQKEEDWAPPHYSHILAKMGGIIKKYKGKLSLTKKGEKLLKDIPNLYKNLLDIYTNKFNWAYISYNPESVGQYGWAFLLFLLLKHGTEEQPTRFYTMKYRMAFPQLMNAFEHNDYYSMEDRFMDCVESRFFNSFCNFFGLATIRKEKKTEGYGFNYFVQKTPLADKIFKLVDYS